MPKTVVAYNMIKKGKNMDYETYVPCCTNDNCQCDDTKCDECDKFTPTLDYKDGVYCTWYCAKKGNK